MGDGVGIKKDDDRTRGWISNIKRVVPEPLLNEVNFSDGAALLVTSESSLADLHPRLEDGAKVVLEKFRPNIVVDGLEAWDEDFWAELMVSRTGMRIILTVNCARCISINVDLEKGKMGEGGSGKLLKKMMRDWRVDTGSKWSPIFGRYGFPLEEAEIKVGDEVVVSRRNEEHTVWSELTFMFARSLELTYSRWSDTPTCEVGELTSSLLLWDPLWPPRAKLGSTLRVKRCPNFEQISSLSPTVQYMYNTSTLPRQTCECQSKVQQGTTLLSSFLRHLGHAVSPREIFGLARWVETAFR